MNRFFKPLGELGFLGSKVQQDMLEQEELTVKERQTQITELSATQVGQLQVMIWAELC